MKVEDRNLLGQYMSTRRCRAVVAAMAVGLAVATWLSWTQQGVDAGLLALWGAVIAGAGSLVNSVLYYFWHKQNWKCETHAS